MWVNSEVNEDGSILVKTYHRTHPNAPNLLIMILRLQ
ncbi:phage tail fiber protein [Proteus vulgaris]